MRSMGIFDDLNNLKNEEHRLKALLEKIKKPFHEEIRIFIKKFRQEYHDQDIVEEYYKYFDWDDFYDTYVERDWRLQGEFDYELDHDIHDKLEKYSDDLKDALTPIFIREDNACKETLSRLQHVITEIHNTERLIHERKSSRYGGGRYDPL